MNQLKIQNVLLLTVDSLRFCYLRAGGNRLNICPVINSLAENGIFCVNARANGFPSQMSFPSIFSSTLPLDFGGYDHGILNRPKSLAEALRDLGLHTIGFSSSPYVGKLFCYEKGFDQFYELFDINKLWIVFSTIYWKYFAELLDKGIIEEGEYCQIIGKLFKKFLVGLQNLCIDKQREITEKKIPYRLELYRHNFEVVQKTLDEISARFQNNPTEFIKTKLNNNVETDLRIFLLGKPTRNVIKSLLVKSVNHLLKRFMVQLWRYEYAPPASYLGERISAAIRENCDRPFFMWTHFLDIHDEIYIGGRVGIPPNCFTLGLAHLLNRSNPAILTHTFSLRFIDHQIAKIITTLKSQGLFDSTLIVITGDHGVCVETAERAGSLFDEVIRVPLIFYNSNFQHRVVTELCSLQDIAPSILTLLGKESCPEFKGRSLVQEPAPTGPVILESLGSGPGDFRFKAIKMAVVHGKYKLIWQEPGYVDSCLPSQNYLFDLEADPNERTNLYDKREYREVALALESIVQERAKKLRLWHQKEKCFNAF